jgi:hypothetical protein
MKKNILSLAVASSVAGLAVSAQAAMYLNPEGTGEVLLFPYYNAQNGNETSMHVVNTSITEAKAVKIRFMEYVNSQEVLDFNVYMSPKDHFAFTIFQSGDGGAIVTRDNTCTVPELGTGTGTYAGSKTTNADGSITRIQPFVPYAYASDSYKTIDRSLAGHVEIIEMGVLVDDTSTTAGSIYPKTWANHGVDGVPANCAGLVAAWSTVNSVNGKWKANVGQSNVTAPTGGLYGVSNMLNNSDAAAYGFEAAAIESFWASNITTEGHTAPGDQLPSLAEGDKVSVVSSAGSMKTLNWSKGIDAVSSLFMAKSIANDVMANPALAGETDWVVTFPTRRYYVGTNPATLPFTDRYIGKITGSGATAVGGPDSSCEVVTITQIDREESTTTTNNGPIFSPAPPPGETQENKLCYETNTIAINGVSALNAGVSTATSLDVAISLPWAQSQPEGWQLITFGDSNYMDPTEAGWLQGLPVMGVAAFEYTNASRPAATNCCPATK